MRLPRLRVRDRTTIGLPRFALRFRAPDRTLTDTETAGLRQAAIDAVIRAHDAELRG